MPKSETASRVDDAGDLPVTTFLDRGRRLMREVDPYVPGLTRESAARLAHAPPEEIVKLSSNENPLGPPPAAVAAAEGQLGVLHEYPSPMANDLRAAIGRYLEVDADQVVVSAGSSTLMHAIVAAFTSPGGEVISLTPSFTVYSEITVIHGRTPVLVPLREDDYLVSFDRIGAAITPRTQLLFLTRPNNPTSTLIPLADFAAAARLAAEVGALVVSDEAYIEFADMDRQSAVELIRSEPERYPNVMLTRTFSKAFGLANLRLGYGVGPPESMRCLALANAKWPTGAVAQAAGVAALEDREHLDKTLTTVSEGRRMLAQGFRDLGLSVAPNPQANYIMVDVAPAGVSAEAFAAAVFERGRILIRGDFSDRHVRISIGRPEENARLVETVREFMEEGQR